MTNYSNRRCGHIYDNDIELVKSSEVTKRPSCDFGITHWMFDDGIPLRSELYLKLDVEDDGEVEWIRTEVATPPSVSDPLQRNRFKVMRLRNKPSKMLREFDGKSRPWDFWGRRSRERIERDGVKKMEWRLKRSG